MAKKTTIYLDEDTKEQAQILCIKEKISLSALINELLKEYLEKNKL